MFSAQPASYGSESDSDRGRHRSGVVAGAHGAQRGRDALHHPVRLPEGVASRTLADHSEGGWVARQHRNLYFSLYFSYLIPCRVVWMWPQGHTPWLCWRSWSPATSTWWKSLRPTRSATVRSPTPWSWCPNAGAHTATRTPGIPTPSWTQKVKSQHAHRGFKRLQASVQSNFKPSVFVCVKMIVPKRFWPALVQDCVTLVRLPGILLWEYTLLYDITSRSNKTLLEEVRKRQRDSSQTRKQKNVHTVFVEKWKNVGRQVKHLSYIFYLSEQRNIRVHQIVYLWIVMLKSSY